jgi:hypothetical protein
MVKLESGRNGADENLVCVAVGEKGAIPNAELAVAE